MKKIFHLLLLLFLTNSYCQVVFEKGYFVNNQNEKIECLIKNQDWINQPKQIEYKLSEDGKTEVTDFNQINSFQVYNTPHYYKKQVVNIDREKNSQGFNPKLEPVILKVLVEGKASLYEDVSTGLFFYKNENEEIKQLIFKRYENKDGKIIEDFSYRTELYNNVKCRDNSAEKIRKLKYKQKMFIDYFLDYNQCINGEYVDFLENKTKSKYVFRALAGGSINTGLKSDVSFSSTTGKRTLEHSNSDLSVNFLVGGEFEILLPYRKNKWAMIFSLTYQGYKDQSTKRYNNVIGRTVTTEIPSAQTPVTTYFGYDIEFKSEYKYSFVELPVGVRYYFDLNNNSKLFVNASYGIILPLNRTENVSFEFTSSSAPSITIDEPKSKFSSLAKIGGGYSFNEKYSVGLDYYIFRNISNVNTGTISVVASYKLF